MGDGGLWVDREGMPRGATYREGTVIGFELVVGRGAAGADLAVGPRMVLPLDEPALVVGLFTGLLSHTLRRGSADREAAAGVRLDCSWAELSAVLSMVASVREAAGRGGLRFRVRATSWWAAWRRN